MSVVTNPLAQISSIDIEDAERERDVELVS